MKLMLHYVCRVDTTESIDYKNTLLDRPGSVFSFETQMKYVYILKAGSDHYKVGIAKNVSKRLSTIQTGNAYKVYVVATKLCVDAERVENMIHNKLLDMSTNGGTEWFKLTPQDVIKVCILLNAEPELDVYDNATLNTQLSEQYQILKNVDKRLNILISNRAVAASNAQVQVNNLAVTSVVNDSKQKKKSEDETLYLQAMRIVMTSNKASVSLLQRKLSIGYGRAARIIEQLEKQGVISPQDGSRPRRLLAPRE